MKPQTDFVWRGFTFSRTCRLLSHSDSPLSVYELHEGVCGQMTQLQPKSLHSQWHFKCQSHISSGSYASSDPNAEPGATFKTPPESIFAMVRSPECRQNSVFQSDCLIHSSTWMTCWSSVTKDTLEASLSWCLPVSHTHKQILTNIAIHVSIIVGWMWWGRKWWRGIPCHTPTNILEYLYGICVH